MIVKQNGIERIFWRWRYKNDGSNAAEEIMHALDWNTSHLLIDAEERTLFGALLYHEVGDYIHIAHVGSLRKGTGSALVKEVLKLRRPTTLYSRDKNYGFYEKLGFVRLPGPSPYKEGAGAKMIHMPS